MPLMFDGVLRKPDHIAYWETCVWYGALSLAQLTRNDELTKKLVARFEPLLGARADLIPTMTRGEPVFGAVAVELYLQTKDSRCLAIGKKLADEAWLPPPAEVLKPLDANRLRMVEQALKESRSWHTRILLDGTYWIDDAYIVSILPIQVFRATGDPIYCDRAAREVLIHVQQLQQPNGLFHHGENAPFFWGRGNGWVAAGLTEVLRSLPEDHPHQERILAGYRKMMATLLQYQDASGMWRQLIDRPDYWPETSCTAMFTFALVTGVKNGWLDADTYAPAARRAWLALTKYINPDADTTEVCEGTNKSAEARYYAERKRNIGDPHGQAAVLWSASAFLR